MVKMYNFKLYLTIKFNIVQIKKMGHGLQALFLVACLTVDTRFQS